jgi:hypothetical protein
MDAPEVMINGLAANRRLWVASTIATMLLLTATWPVAAASPSPSGVVGGDARSPGQGPGLVGDPLVAILIVVAIGLAAVALTLVYVRLTGGRRT